ncbi:MAG TPA: glycosyltransferase family 4 protein [Candidatus Paceibacterota bacterium]|nr:glycosyltransferase family 4 protein [Candidatus Paceibacterota bacterium]
MKALFISTDSSIPDVTSATRMRMQAYAEAIGEMHVLLRAKRARTTTDGAITIHEVCVAKPLIPFKLAKHAHAIIKKYDIDIVSTQDPFEYGWVGMKACKGTKAKLHVQIHTDLFSPWFTRGSSSVALLNRIRLMMADRVLPKADGIRVVAPRIERSLRARYKNSIVSPVIIPIAMPDVQKESTALEAPFPFTLLAAARLEPEKRLHDLIHAVAEVRKLYPTVGLVLAGEGRERGALRALARTHGIENYVRFLGTRADVPDLMGAAHAYIQTSAYEGYGLALVEAARNDLPIITTNVGIVGDVLLPGTHALVSEPGDIQGIVQHIRALIEDNRLRITLAQAAEQAVREHLLVYANQPQMIADDLRDTVEKARLV